VAEDPNRTEMNSRAVASAVVQSAVYPSLTNVTPASASVVDGFVIASSVLVVT
jgi:hypothetical protein